MAPEPSTAQITRDPVALNRSVQGDADGVLARAAVSGLLQYIGEDPTREGLRDTPKRVVKALREMTAGYEMDAAKVLSTVFENPGYDQMVVLQDIEFVSLCEHHMLPFAGTAVVGYIPRGRVVGLSKLARLVEMYAKRLQIQEQLTQQIVSALDYHLQPLGAGCIIKAHHGCMSCRGVMQKRTVMVTSALSGAMRDLPEVRAEFLAFSKE